MGSKKSAAKIVAKIGSEIEMTKVQNLRLRGRTFYYHRDLPKDVRHLFNGASQRWVSLRTSDFQEAKRKCLERTLEDDQLIHSARNASANHETVFTEDYLDELVQAWKTEWLRSDEQLRMKGQINSGEVKLAGVAHSPESLKKLISLEITRGREGIAPIIVEGWLEAQSIPMSKELESFMLLCYKTRQAILEGLSIISQRTKGDLVPSPPAIKPKKPKQVATLQAMIEPWMVRQKPKESSIREFKRSAQRFSELHPKLLLEDIEAIHIVEFRDHLSSKGLSPASVEKSMNVIKALLNIAVERNVIKFNPASRVKPPKATVREQDRRQPFDTNQLNMLFSSPAYVGGKVSGGGKGPVAYWLPLMGLFTGARIEELCQLRLEDILEEDGVPYIFIRRKHKDQDTKTDSSVRRVPIHAELIRLGFFRYVEIQKERKREWLFHQLVPDVHGDRSGNWSKWFHRYLREQVGIHDKTVVFHSFRHTFKATCRECSITEEIHDALTGHTNGSVGRSYGGSLFPLRPLSEAIKKYELKGVKLPLPFKT